MDDVKQREQIRAEIGAALFELGADTSTPQAITELRADLAFLRRQRKGSEQFALYARRFVFVGVALPGLVWLLWEGLKAAIRLGGTNP